jgi:outer membrane receptor protein involved in Fe transport
MNSRVDELFQEVGDSSIQEQPRVTKSNQDLTLNSYSGYAQDIINFNEYYRADLGVRLLRYEYNKETLLSPRIGLHYFFDVNNTFNLSWGYYDQPPFFHEVVSRSDSSTSHLKSQQAVHYVLGWEHDFKHDLTFEVETYYKQLDRLIPFYLDQMKLIYADQNSLKGYAYGFDVLLRGQVTKDINSWISYGYLNTREKPVGSDSPYERRLLDQTHTLRFFLQDKMPSLPNVQVHNRMLFGTGYLYYPEKVVTDAQGNKSLAVDFDHRFTYPFYFRADIGFSARLKLGKRSEMIVIAEVLNAFNRANVASYSWFPVYPSDPSPVKVPQVLSDRFFNLGVELRLE